MNGRQARAARRAVQVRRIAAPAETTPGWGPKAEPALYTGGAVAAFAGVVAVLSAFGYIHWTAEQQAAAAALALLVLPWLQGLITRQWVRPVWWSAPAQPGDTATDPRTAVGPNGVK